MGIVYEGRDPRLDRRVAIKTILRSAIMDEESARDFAARFVREAQAVARLTHPNIVGVYDFGEEDDVTFIVMEYIDGKELKSFLDDGHRFDFPSTVRIMSELLDGLGYAHQQGVVHRDIKPANIMIDPAGHVKLTDFGVARVTESAERTQVGTMVGTPSYMSPEQIQGASTDNRTDIFACGVLLYQLLTGQKPFAGTATWTIYNQILLQEPPAPAALNTALPPAIDQVVARALAKNKEDRYRNAADMAAALTALLRGTAAGATAGEVDPDATRFILPPDAGAWAEPAMPRRAEDVTASPGRADMSTSTQSATGVHELDLEFWRAIKDSPDPADHELYVQKFPTGVYAELARRKALRLRDPAARDATDGRLMPFEAAAVDPDTPHLAPHMTGAPRPAAGAAEAAGADTTIPRLPPAARTWRTTGKFMGAAAALAGVAFAAWMMSRPDAAQPVAPALVSAPAAVPAAAAAAAAATAAASPSPSTPGNEAVSAPAASRAPATTTAASSAPPPDNPQRRAASPSPAGGSTRVQPKHDEDALLRIESAIERAGLESDRDAAARKRAASRQN